MPHCLTCGAGVDELDSAYYSRNMLCIPCWTRKSSEVPMTNCAKCGLRMKESESRRRAGGFYCNYCNSEIERAERTVVCQLCKKPVESWQKTMKTPGGVMLHVECAEKSQRRGTPARCIRCGKETSVYNVTNDGLVVCLACARRDAESTEDSTLLSRLVGRIGAMIG